MSAAERIMEVVADLAPQDRLRIAVEAGDEDPTGRLERIEAGLRSGALPLDVPGQISGYWYGPDETIPSTSPDWMPTGALLARPGESLSNGATVLDLVSVDYVWFPLSMAGTYTYAHSAGLRRGERWRFVPIPSSAHPWPTAYVAELAEPLVPRAVAELYGVEASKRAREDESAVQLRVEPDRATSAS